MQVLTKVQVIFEHSRSDYNSFCYLCSVCRKLHSWYLANRHLCSSVSTVLQMRMFHHAFLIPRGRLQQLIHLYLASKVLTMSSAQMPFLEIRNGTVAKSKMSMRHSVSTFSEIVSLRYNTTFFSCPTGSKLLRKISQKQ